jgi:hypothetical protein
MSDWRYPGLPKEEQGGNPCDGCHECGMRCTSGIHMTEPEFAAIVEHLGSLEPRRVVRVLEQDKRVHWFEDVWQDACVFYDVANRGCLIYPVRPLICHLFGRVEWLPCPLQKPLPLLSRGLEIIQAYSYERRATFAEWCMAQGIFDLRRLARGDQPELPPAP